MNNDPDDEGLELFLSYLGLLIIVGFFLFGIYRLLVVMYAD